jgi:hypothetical protein
MNAFKVKKFIIVLAVLVTTQFSSGCKSGATEKESKSIFSFFHQSDQMSL